MPRQLTCPPGGCPQRVRVEWQTSRETARHRCAIANEFRALFALRAGRARTSAHLRARERTEGERQLPGGRARPRPRAMLGRASIYRRAGGSQSSRCRASRPAGVALVARRPEPPRSARNVVTRWLERAVADHRPLLESTLLAGGGLDRETRAGSLKEGCQRWPLATETSGGRRCNGDARRLRSAAVGRSRSGAKPGRFP